MKRRLQNQVHCHLQYGIHNIIRKNDASSNTKYVERKTKNSITKCIENEKKVSIFAALT